MSLTGNTTVIAGNQLTIAASDVAAGENVTLVGKDVTFEARQDTVDTHTTQTSQSSGFSVGMTLNPVEAYQTARDGATANMPDSGGAMSKLSRTAEGVTSGTRAATTAVVIQAGSHSSQQQDEGSTSTARVSSVSAGNHLTVLATDGSITSQGAQLSAEGDALLLARQDIVLDVAHNTETAGSQGAGSGWSVANNTTGLPLGMYNHQDTGNGGTDTLTGTQLSVGGNTRMATQEGDITLTAANVVSQGDINLSAARNLTVQSGQDTVSNTNQRHDQAVGTVVISDTERFMGYHAENHNDHSDQVTQVSSNIASLNGNVNLTAGNTYTQTASNVLAANEVNVTAKSIELLTADNLSSNHEDNDSLKVGVFARVKSPLIDLINNIDAARESDGRVQTMQGMAAAASAYQAASAISSLAGGAGSGSLISAEAGIGFATSQDQQDGTTRTAQGSTISGGGNVTLTSTSGDIHAVQGTLQAGDTLTLDSAQAIVLEAGQSTVTEQGSNSYSGAEVGVGVSVGAQTGFYAYAQAQMGSGSNETAITTYENTHLAGDTITLRSQGDTTLRGADAQANTINADIGGALSIESLQDTVAQASESSAVGVRVQVSFGTAWSASGYASSASADGQFTQVNQQSGLFAGDGGYHINADSVNLKGGAITSTNAANSALTADSLTFSDLHNSMDYQASSASVSGGVSGTSSGTGQNAGTNNVGAQTLSKPTNANFSGGVPMSESGKDSSTTYATLTEGNITLGGVSTTAAATGIHTDASTAHTAIKELPDLQKVLADQQAMAAAAGTVMATSKQVADDIAANAQAKANAIGQEVYDSLSPEAKQAVDQLSQSEREAFLSSQSSDFAAANNTAKNWGTGGDYSRALGVITTALVGGVSGQGATQTLTNALAPYAAQLIGNQFDPNHGTDPNKAAQILSHAILGALLAEVNGGSAVGGALAGAGGELAAQYLAQQLFGSNPNDLTEDQKQTVSALSSMLGALAGGITSGDNGGLFNAAVGGNVAKNAVENNWLLQAEIDQADKERAACAQAGGDVRACQDTVTRRMDELDKAREKEWRNYQGTVQQEVSDESMNGDLYGISKEDYIAAIKQRAATYWTAYNGVTEDTAIFTGYAPAQETGYFLRSMGNSVVGMAKFFGRPGWEVGWDIVKGTWNGITGAATATDEYLSSPIPALYMQNGIDNSLTMTTQEGANVAVGSVVGLATEGVLGKVLPGKLTSNGTADAAAGAKLADDLARAQSYDPLIGTTLPGSSGPIQVTAEATVGGKTFIDVNQKARVIDPTEANKQTLISELVEPGNPNGTYGSAHAEINAIQQAYDAGFTQGQSMSIVVRGKSPCDYCKSNLADMANAAGLNKLTVIDGATGQVLQWVRGGSKLIEIVPAKRPPGG